MDVFPFSIKIKQTNQTESLKVKGNSRTISPPMTSFNQIFHNIHKSTNSSEQKKMGNLKNITNQENNIKNIDKMDSVKLKLSAVIASLTTRIQETQKQQDPNFGVLPTDQDSQFQLTDASISHNSIQQEAGDSSIDLSLFLTVLKDMEKGEAIETIELLKQTLDLIKKLPIEEKQKWLEAIEFTNFQGFNQQQPLKDSIQNFSEDFPEYKIVEDLKFTEEHGTSRNQTASAIFIDEQSDLVSRAIIEKNGSQPPPVFPVSQFVPVLIEMIGEFLTTIPEQNGSSEAKISLQPDELGSVQIIITSEQGKVTLQIVTETISGKNTIENQSLNLKQTLQQQGIFIQKIEINHQPQMEEQSFISPVISMENQAQLTKVVESQPAFNTSEILANQQMHQPEKTNELNIKSKEPQSVIQVSQFVPEMSEWIGELVKSIPIPEQYSLTEAKISLQPEHLGPIQIKVTNDNRKVTVHIFTETNSGKKALDIQLSNLKQTLQQQGVFVEKIDISHQPPVEEQSFMSSMKSKENPAPIKSGAESQPAFKTTEILANQQMHQPEKINELNIKSKEPQSVIQVSQFVPEVSEWIGELVKAMPQQSSTTEAKISLQPDHFGPMQIKVTNDNGKVTAKIVTDTIFAKDTIEVQLPQLRQALQQQGILVQKLEISHQPQTEEQSFMSSMKSKENPAPIRSAAESQPAFKTTEILANQQMQQPEKINKLNIKSKEPQSVIQVSQFVPEVSEWIGELVKAMPQQSSTTEAKISLQPDHFGPIQIKVTNDNGKVTAKIVTDTIFAKDTIEVQLPQLRQALQQQGVFVEKIDISHQPPVEEKSFMTSVVNKENPAPIRSAAESQPAFKTTEILANQQVHQPDKPNELNIKSKEPQSVIQVSQFVPEVSEWIGELVKAIPQQSITTEAKISLQPDHFGPIQIKVTNDTGKVTAKIVTDTIFAKDTIEVQLPQLRQALQQQGIHVQKLEISHQPLLVKDLIQAINTPFSNQGFFTSSIGAREKPVSTTKTLEKQNIMTSWGSKGKQVILQKTVEEQKIPTARGSGENQTSFPITVEEQITITTQEKRIDQTHWSKSEEVPMTAEERSNHAPPQPPVEEQSNISTMPSVEQQTPLKKAFEEPRILPSMNTRGDPIFDSNLEIKSSNLMPEEYKEEQIPVTKNMEEQSVFDSSEKIVIQQMQQPDKLVAAKPIAPPPVIPVSQFVPEISKWIEGVIRTNPEQFGSTEAKFSLNPEKLGPIQIKITTEQGKVTAQIVTDTIFAKEALELQLPQLRQALQQQGILVQKLEIIQQNLQYADFAQSNNSFSQGSSGFSQDQRANTSSQNGPKKQKESNKEEIVKEMVFTTYGGRGPRSTQSNIDFTA